MKSINPRALIMAICLLIAFSSYGNALWILGARGPCTAGLEEAVTAYRNALEELTRDRVPLNCDGTTYEFGYTKARIA